MVHSKHLHESVMKRFSEKASQDEAATRPLIEQDRLEERHLRQFIKMATYRKRTILERMLLD